MESETNPAGGSSGPAVVPAGSLIEPSMALALNTGQDYTHGPLRRAPEGAHLDKRAQPKVAPTTVSMGAR